MDKESIELPSDRVTLGALTRLEIHPQADLAAQPNKHFNLSTDFRKLFHLVLATPLADVESALTRPDYFQQVISKVPQHILLSVEAIRNQVAFGPRRVAPKRPPRNFAEGIDARSSIFMKHMSSSPKIEPYWLLVHANFKDGLNHALSAWRIYAGELDHSEIREPIDVLHAVANRFGCPVRVSGTTADSMFSQFLPYEEKPRMTVPSQPKFSYSHAAISSFRESSSINSPQLTATKEASFTCVSLAYCIDLEKYRRYLQRHGVNVDVRAALAPPRKV